MSRPCGNLKRVRPHIGAQKGVGRGLKRGAVGSDPSAQGYYHRNWRLPKWSHRLGESAKIGDCPSNSDHSSICQFFNENHQITHLMDCNYLIKGQEGGLMIKIGCYYTKGPGGI